MKSKNRENLLKLAAGAAVIILLGDSIVLQPLAAKWKDTGDQIADLREKYERGSQLTQRERNLQRSWRVYQRDDLDDNKSLAENQVLRAMENWMVDSGIKLTAIKPQWQNYDDRYNTYSIRLTADGSMQQCVSFIHKIENDPLPVKVEEVEFASRDKDGSNIALTLHISGIQLGKSLTGQ